MSGRTVVFVASHLGYPMDRTPLGGGAMVGLRLARRWAQDPRCRLYLLGSGPAAPAPGGEYVRLAGVPRGLVHLSELEYARFCRRFEEESTSWILEHRARLPARSTCVVVNDICEGPNLEALSRAGYPLVSIWHVDVVDYFNKLYLKGLLRPATAVGLYERLRRLGGRRVLPDVLQLVFEKQRETVARSARMVFPSSGMAETVSACYGGRLCPPQDLAARSLVLPWGSWAEPHPEEARAAERIRAHYQIGPESLAVLTLSRISPEKGLHLLIEALRLLEARGQMRGRDVCLLIAGEPAFMQGRAYVARVRRAASRLKSVRVFFPGYLSEPEKRAFLRAGDLFVSPSVHESYGLNIVEAMRAGLPILASDHYGVKDILAPGCGRVAPYPSLREAPAALAEAFAEMTRERAALKEMGRRARAAAEAMPFSRAADALLDAALALAREPAVLAR